MNEDSRRAAAIAAPMTYGGVLLLQLLHRFTGGAGHDALPWFVQMLRDGSLLLPLVVGAVLTVQTLVREPAGDDPATRLVHRAVLPATTTAWVLAATYPLVAGLVGGSAHSGLPLPVHVSRDALILLAWCLPMAAATCLTGRSRRTVAAAPVRRRRPGRLLVAGGSVIGFFAVAAAPLITVAPAATGAEYTGVCANATRTVSYDVEAMSVDLPINGWGDHIPDGMIYALSNRDAFPNADDLRAEPGRATPLVLRANVGDCIKVRFHNSISDKRVGMHVDGVAKQVTGPEASDGANIGYNTDSTVATGESRTYTWYAQRTGQFPINDYGSGTNYGMVEPTTDTTSRGLYGALVILPQNYTWHEPTTGKNLLVQDGPGQWHGVGAPVFADAQGPGVGDDFRDLALLFLDEPEGIVNRDGEEPTYPVTGVPDSSFGFNYRAEPLRNRLQAMLDHRDGKVVTLPNGTVILPEDHFCDGWTNDQDEETNRARLAKDQGLSGCLGEESHLQSWTFGDPGKITRAVDEVDRLTIANATGGTFTLTVKDPTLTAPLTEDGAADLAAPRFRGERTTTEPIPFPATAAGVQAALMSLKPLPMAELAEGDITVTGGPDPAAAPGEPVRYTIAFGQHFAGRDVEVSADGSGLTDEPAGDDASAGEAAAGATVEGEAAEGESGIEVEVETEVQPGAEVEPRTATGDDIDAGTGADVESQATTETDAAEADRTEPVSRSGRTFLAARKPDRRPKSKPTPEPAPKPAPQPEPAPEPAPQPAPEPEPEVTHDHDPAPVPADQPGTGLEDEAAHEHEEGPEDEAAHVEEDEAAHVEDETEDETEHAEEPAEQEPAPLPEDLGPIENEVFDPSLGPVASVTDESRYGGRKGEIIVLSDALIPHAYRGDPVRVRLIHPGVKETHPFHQHTNRWRQESEDPDSTVLDVQSIGPGQALELVYDGGAGEAITGDPANPSAGPKTAAEWLEAGRPDLAALAITRASNGDQIFHCHLYPHFAQGFWGVLRVFDRQRPVDQSLWPAGVPRTYPDATPIEPLVPLGDLNLIAKNKQGQDVAMTPMPDAAHPGYPLMVKGEYLQRAFRAPGGVVADRFGDPALNWRRPGDTVRDYADPVTTDLERANMVTDENNRAIPGAFFMDPCPAGAPVREYHPTVIDAKIVYNKAGWHDPGGKLYVEAPPSDPADPSTSIDVAARIRNKIMSGSVQTEPYNMRAQIGECVNMRATNATHLDNDLSTPLDVHDGQLANGQHTGNNAFHMPTLMSELSLHVHLVRFDELGTDGTSVGWNYVQAPMVGQTYNYRWFVDVPLRTVYFHDHQNPNTHQQHGLWAAMNVEPKDSVWTSPTTGAPLAPAYCKNVSASAPALSGGTPCYGVGSVSDIKVADPAKPGSWAASFREFTVNYSDFVPLYDAAGRPVNPPEVADDFATDQGGMGINYRNEPFPIRINSSRTGLKKEPAYIFSSAVHGDPSTPLFRAYPGDPVIFRFIGGAHEEAHNFTLSGHRWLHEPDDPDSALSDSQFAMTSEFFNFEVSGAQVVKRGSKSDAVEKAREAGGTEAGATMVVPGGAGAPGDYMYGSMPLNDLWMGMWGIFRVPAKRVPDLQPLPTNAAPAPAKKGNEWPALKPGELIKAKGPLLDPCPNGAPKRSYDVSIVRQKIVYNAAGDHDPNGVAYVLDSELDPSGAPKAGTNLKPLFIRANEGDCLSITLTNRLPVEGISVGEGDPPNPVEKVGDEGTSTVTNLDNGKLSSVAPVWPAGNRASLHASGLVRHEVTSSDGAAVGYNYDSTIAPGRKYTYSYYIDNGNLGVINFTDFGNLRGTRHHGAWGGLVVSPKGATYHHPTDLAPLAAGEEAVIKYVDRSGATRAYREFIVDVQDGLNLFDKSGEPITAPEEEEPADGPVELEDEGEVGINYRTEPFAHRLSTGADIADVFSSTVFGDPATPVFRAYANDPVMVRVLNSSDLPRAHTFGINGHSWRYEPHDPNSNIVTAQGGLNTGRTFNAGICAGSNLPLDDLTGSATCGTDGQAGDFLYGDRNFFHMLSGGIWGLIRVHADDQSDLARLPGK